MMCPFYLEIKMKLKKFVERLNKYLEENPNDGELKVTVSKRSNGELKDKVLGVDIGKSRRNYDNTRYNCEFDHADFYRTEVTINIGEI